MATPLQLRCARTFTFTDRSANAYVDIEGPARRVGGIYRRERATLRAGRIGRLRETGHACIDATAGWERLCCGDRAVAASLYHRPWRRPVDHFLARQGHVGRCPRQARR